MVFPFPNIPYHYTFAGLLRITRVWNLLIVILAQYFTALFLANGSSDYLEVILSERMGILTLSTVLIAAAGYVINDYYDVKIDLINKPSRVVVGKFMKRRVAMIFHVLLNVTGVGLGFLISWKVALVNLICGVLLWLYSNQLKRLPLIGNIVVSLLTAMAIYVVHFIFPSGHIMVIAYSIFAFSFTLIREIIKDMEDLKGDASFGCRTLPVVIGIRKTKWVIYILSAIFVLSLFIMSLVFVGPQLAIFSASLLLPLTWLTYNLTMADTIRDFKKLSTHCKVIMFIGILSMVLF